jgi:CheY-like chemotaxis protein
MINKTILIVDDEAHIRNDLVSYLSKKRKFSPNLVSTFNDALLTVKIEGSNFDHAIIDLKLDNPSEYGGIQVFLAIKKHHPTVTPIILSAYPFAGEVESEFRRIFRQEIKDEIQCEVLLREVQDNYISKGGEKNYMLAILEKLEELEEKKHREMCDAKYGCFYALLIAESDYEQTTKLTCPIDDARKLKDVLLSRYLFSDESVELLEEPDRKTILGKFAELSKRMTPQDNLLIFYAGHGHWDEDCKDGYWLPKNAELDNRSEWVSYSDVRQHLKRIQSKHILLINDACFGGGVTREIPDTNVTTAQVYAPLSRKAMTSGALQSVPDKSVFMKYLLHGLENNGEEYLATPSLYAKIFDGVQSEVRHLQPEYNLIPDTGDKGGHFVFVQKSIK